MTWRKYPNLRAWCVGRILRARGGSLAARRLAKAPAYILATELDVLDCLRELRDQGVIAAASRRWYVRNVRAAQQIGRPLKPKAVANDA